MPLTFRSGESIGAAKARQSAAKTTTTKKRRRATPKGGSTMASQKAATAASNKKSVIVSPAPAAKITKVPVKATPKPAPTPAAKATPKGGATMADQKAATAISKSIADTDTKEAAFQRDVLASGLPEKKTAAPASVIAIAPKATASATAIAPKVAKPTGDPRNEPTTQQSTSAAIAKPSSRPDVLAAPVSQPAAKEPAPVASKTTPMLAKHVPDVDPATYKEVATSQTSGALSKVSPVLGAVIKDKYRNEEVSYNQAYWASKLAGGATQKELAAEQQAIGMKKAYSGDVVVTPDMKRKAADDLKRVTGSMATLQNGGVTKTEEKTGLLGEGTTTKYAYKDGPTVTTKATDPVIKSPLGDVRLGEKVSTTYVDGVEVATKTGGDALGVGAKVTTPEGVATHVSDTAKIEPMDGLNTVDDIQKAIEATTDKSELAALHKRLRSLMRAQRTRTQFGGLNIGEADVEATKLSGLRIR